jgi:hypothetical protein
MCSLGSWVDILSLIVDTLLACLPLVLGHDILQCMRPDWVWEIHRAFELVDWTDVESPPHGNKVSLVPKRRAFVEVLAKNTAMEQILSLETLCECEAYFLPSLSKPFGFFLSRELNATDDNDNDCRVLQRLEQTSLTRLLYYHGQGTGLHEAIPRRVGSLYGKRGILWMLFVMTHILSKTPRQGLGVENVMVWFDCSLEGLRTRPTSGSSSSLGVK